MSSRTLRCVMFLTIASLFLPATAAFGRAPKKYQVTGKVLEVHDDLLVVDKDGEKWEIARDKSTKVDGSIKVGQKVTVHYAMSAGSVEIKDEKATPAPQQKPEPTKKPEKATK